MVQCYAPGCNHQSESHCCKFYRFPKENKERKRWINLIRRWDREPNAYARVCSCHFQNGVKASGPEIFERNKNKLFPSNLKKGSKTKKKKILNNKGSADQLPTVASIIESIKKDTETDEHVEFEGMGRAASGSHIVMEVELDCAYRELEKMKEGETYLKSHYSVSGLSADVIRMETGLPTKECFHILVEYVGRFRDSINYFAGWKIDSITLEDQLFITLMKLRQNYTNLHLGQLFSCSIKTISNIVITFVHVLHTLFFNDLMSSIPTRDKNRICAPSSFSSYNNCRIVIDCTEIEIATPGLMNQQNVTYSSYRGMNSFKVIVGVAPNAVITYVSNLYPGSVSDKVIVQQSGLLKHLVTGDLILADKGFLIQDIVPPDVTVNIPPFLNNGNFSESEVKVTKSVARCRIHVERANARLKYFKILKFIPSYMRCYADKLFQLCATLVNLQFPLIKEGCEGTNFD